METKLTTVAKVNGVDILIIEGDEKRVAIKPICEALGIAFQRQIERLKEDPILGSTVTLGVTVGAVGKQREMVTIPFKFVFMQILTEIQKFAWNTKHETRNTKHKVNIMRKKNTELLSDVIRQVLKEQHLDTPLYEKRLIESWPLVLGNNILKYTSELNIKNRVLYVNLTSSVLRHDLFLSRTEIKNSLNKHVGAEVIVDIIFR